MFNFYIGLFSVCIESNDICSQHLIVDTYSLTADIALRDAAAVMALDDGKSMLADIAGCSDTTMSYEEVIIIRDKLN